MKAVFYVLAGNTTEDTWLVVAKYDSYSEAENFLKGQRHYLQYRIEKVWSRQF